VIEKSTFKMGAFLFSQIYCSRDSSENKFLAKRTTYTVAKYLSVIKVQNQGICYVGEQVQVPWSLWLCFWCFFFKDNRYKIYQL
jgi:hypothetical protein